MTTNHPTEDQTAPTSPPAAAEPAMLTVDAVAARLSCSAKWVRALVKRGDLPHIRIGTRAIRVRPADLAAYMTPP